MVWCEKLGKYTGHWNIETMLQIQLGAFDLDRILGETHTHTELSIKPGLSLDPEHNA